MNLQGLTQSDDLRRVLDNQSLRLYFKKNNQTLLPLYEQLSELHLNHIRKLVNDGTLLQKLSDLVAQNTRSLQVKKGAKRICFNRQPPFYTCYDCELSQNSIICAACFKLDQHRGHQFTKNQTAQGYCDCGNKNVVKQLGTCSRHGHIQQQPLPLNEYKQIKQILADLLALGLALGQVPSVISNTNKEKMLLQVLQKIRAVSLNGSQAIQDVVAQVLLSRPVEIFWGCHGPLIRPLLMTDWSDTIQQQVGNILCDLCANPSIGEVALPLIYQILSSEGTKASKKFMHWNQYIIHSLFHAQVVQRFMCKKNAKWFVIKQEKPTIDQITVYELIYGRLIKYHPTMLFKFTTLLIQQVPISKWIPLSPTTQTLPHPILQQKENKFVSFVVTFLKAVWQKPQAKNFQFKELAQKAFWTAWSAPNQIWPYMIFAMAFLALYDFDLNAIRKLKRQQLRQTLSLEHVSDTETAQSFQAWLFKILASFSVSFQDQGQLNCMYRLRLALMGVTVNLICIFYQKFQTGSCNLLKRYLQTGGIKIEETKKADQTSKRLISLSRYVASLLFFTRDQNIHLALIKQAIMGQQEVTFSIFKDLSVVHGLPSKKDMNHVLLSWSDDELLIKQFLTQNYDSLKTKPLQELTLQNQMSFNSPLCHFELTKQKSVRLKANLQRQSRKCHGSEQIRIEDMKRIVRAFRQYLGQIKQQSIYQKKAPIINSWVQMLITVYLENRSPLCLQLFQQITKTLELSQFLSSFNKEHLQLLQQTVFQSTKTNHTQQKEAEGQTKKAKKLRQLKEKQQRVIQSIGISEAEQEKRDQKSCIICRLAEEKAPLYFLSHAKPSRVLRKTMFGQDSTILLLTTCGHLIHEECLNQSLEGNRNFHSDYQCFLCKAVSNIRLPLTPSITPKYLKGLFDQVLTILSIYNQKVQQNIRRSLKGAKSTKQVLRQAQFATLLYQSVCYQVLIYYQSYSQLYIYYMLPILPTLLAILKQYHQNKLLPEGIKLHQRLNAQKHVMTHIQDNVNQLITNPTVLSQQTRHRGEEDRLDKLFKRIAGKGSPELPRVKNIARFKLYKPPQDLLDLKRLAGLCSDCGRIHDKIRICLECQATTCAECEGQWGVHRNVTHLGTLANIMVRDGTIYYESSQKRNNFPSLYRNYVGEAYMYDKWNQVKEGQYLLDQGQYEKVVEDLVMERVYHKVQNQNRDVQNQLLQLQNNCQVQ